MNQLDERLTRAVGSAPVHYRPVAGGYSSADRFVVTLADGRSVFVKSAEADNLAGWLRREHEVYGALAGSFLAELVGWDDDGERPVLVLEDLSGHDWTPRWDGRRIGAVREALAELAAQPAPPEHRGGRRIAARSASAAGRSSPRIRAVPLDRPARRSLARAGASNDSRGRRARTRLGERAVPPRRPQRQPVLSRRTSGAGRLELGVVRKPRRRCRGLAPQRSGRRRPRAVEILSESGELAAFVAGVWAAVVGLPAPETAPSVRGVQRAQLAVALDWIDRELGLARV